MTRTRFSRWFVFPLLMVVAVHCPVALAAEWPQWRGPEGQGHAPASAKNLPTAWSETENVKWLAEVPGRGYSSPVVEGKQIWMTTAVEFPVPPDEAKKRQKESKAAQPLTFVDQVEFRAVCVDRETGSIVHNILLFTEKDPQGVHVLNSYASPSPVIEAGRLYCHFGSFGTACVDASRGEVVWTNRDHHCKHENGPGGSPILWNNHVIFMLDGSDIRYVAALDKSTGKLAWKTDRTGQLHPNDEFKKSYGTPIVVSINGREQLFAPGADWMYGYDPAGKELWKLSYGTLGFSITPRPVVGHGMIYMSTGFLKPEILAIRYEGRDKAEIAWRFKQGAPTMPSPLLIGEELYFVSDTGVFTCLDALSGKEIYRQRLGGNFSSSPVFADGKIYAGNREGAVYVITPGREFATPGKNELPGKIMATPIAVENALYVRADNRLFRIENMKDKK